MYRAKDFCLSPKDVPMGIMRKEYSYYKQSIRPIERMIAEHTLRNLSRYMDIEVHHTRDKRMTTILIGETSVLKYSGEIFESLKSYGEPNNPYKWSELITSAKVLTIGYSKFDFTGIEALAFIIDSINQSISKIESDNEPEFVGFETLETLNCE